MPLKYIALVLLILATQLYCKAQYKVTLLVQVPVGNTLGQPYYFASNTNRWSPNDVLQQLQPVNNNTYRVTIANCPTLLLGKFTTGSWFGVECNSDGSTIDNRSFTISSDTTITITVAAFAQSKQLTSTRTKQVTIITDSFYIPQLKAKRRVWIYLPKAYNNKKKFAVLYMHDGQNLFDISTGYSGEWGVDEYLDSATNTCIVVGIDNGGATRMTEYNPYTNFQFGKGVGNAYAKFVVQTLKPYIDKKYKTLTGKQYTYMAGSSMGGLITYYTALQYPNVFGKVGIFSSAFWLNWADVQNEIKQIKKLSGQNFYFYAGAKESESMVAQTVAMYNNTKATCNQCAMQLSIAANGEHKEWYWQQELPKFFGWLLGK